jgi:fructose-bisphosphate aldolase class I
MVLAGTKSVMSKPTEVADATLKVLNNSVPKEVAGIVFLSGGQSPEQATANLNAIGLKGEQPWPITYSYSRAVQDPVLKLWRGKEVNTKKAQAMFSKLLAQNSAARNGQFTGKKVF